MLIFGDFMHFQGSEKLEVKFSENLGQNICKILSHISTNFFTRSETELDDYPQNVNVQVTERLKTGLRILG